MFRLISAVICIVALAGATYFFVINEPGLSVPFIGVALIDAVNYFGRRREAVRGVGQLRKSKPLGMLLVCLLVIPAAGGCIGSAIGSSIGDAMDDPSGLAELVYGVFGVIGGFVVGIIVALM